MQTLESALNELVADGVVEYDDAVAVSMYPKEMRRAAQMPAPTREAHVSGAPVQTATKEPSSASAS